MKTTKLDLERIKKLGAQKYALYEQKLAIEAQIIGLGYVKEVLNEKLEKISKELERLMQRLEK